MMLHRGRDLRFDCEALNERRRVNHSFAMTCTADTVHQMSKLMKLGYLQAAKFCILEAEEPDEADEIEVVKHPRHPKSEQQYLIFPALLYRPKRQRCSLGAGFSNLLRI